MTNNNEDQSEVAANVENILQNILKELEAGNTDVDIEKLLNSIETYSSFPDFEKEKVQRWKENIEQITKLLEAQYLKVQQELQEMMQNNPKIAAYDKANDIEEDK